MTRRRVRRMVRRFAGLLTAALLAGVIFVLATAAFTDAEWDIQAAFGAALGVVFLSQSVLAAVVLSWSRRSADGAR